MRVITGTARGRKLITLEGNDVRPTTDRVKEAVYSMIQFQTEGRRFLDLFAGSGQIGIEALSRGAQSVVFVDTKREAIEIIKKNLHATNLEKNAKVLQIDFKFFLEQADLVFDIAFLDPPYKTGMLQQALPLVAKRMAQGGLILCEHPTDEVVPEIVGDFVKDRQRRYGKIFITVYRHKDVNDE